MPGKQNVIADALSRPLNSCEVNFVSIDFSRKGASDYRKSQQGDPDIENIIEAVENDDENVLRLTNKGYIMIDCYRYCESEDTENGQLVIPKPMRDQALFSYHNDPSAGHMGIAETIQRITPYYFWPGNFNLNKNV